MEVGKVKSHIVGSGNPVNGFQFYGPFEGHEAALDWVDLNLDSDWWIVELENPEEVADRD